MSGSSFQFPGCRKWLFVSLRMSFCRFLVFVFPCHLNGMCPNDSQAPKCTKRKKRWGWLGRGESDIRWGMPDQTSYALDAWQVCKTFHLTYGESYAIRVYRNADKGETANDESDRKPNRTFPHARVNGRIAKVDRINQRSASRHRRLHDVEFAVKQIWVHGKINPKRHKGGWRPPNYLTQG